MTATIIDGKAVAAHYRAQIAERAAAFTAARGNPPGLGVVLVGDNAASQTYVRMKQKACEEVGIYSVREDLPQDATTEAVVEVVRAMNADPSIHGILVQLPMPPQVDEEAVLREISLEKDADGIHPLNMGLLALKGREPLYTPATPTGVMLMFEYHDIDLNGANAVVIGRSNIVGMPMALLLNNANATVTVAHSRTKDIASIVRAADIVIAAAGRAGYVKADWLKPGAVVIDVGTNRVDAPEKKRGYKLVGDVDFDAALDVAGYITKVPGGVGPMTITALLYNTMHAADRSAS
ncbi:MAG: bifunctional 5,10-methylenetetrahydrofolate dehydrogenase/5,10-methenyltetrahydrofolate cyclohydrolase [Chloroflexota bacterium]